MWLFDNGTWFTAQKYARSTLHPWSGHNWKEIHFFYLRSLVKIFCTKGYRWYERWFMDYNYLKWPAKQPLPRSVQRSLGSSLKQYVLSCHGSVVKHRTDLNLPWTTHLQNVEYLAYYVHAPNFNGGRFIIKRRFYWSHKCCPPLRFLHNVEVFRFYTSL